MSVDIPPTARLVQRTAQNYRGGSQVAQVLLENAQRGSAPPAGSDLITTVPRVPGLPPGIPLVSTSSKKIEDIYVQVSRRDVPRSIDNC